MIRHLFLMIWNQKRRNMGLMLEIFFSFMVLFAVLTFILYNYNHYRQPLGFDYKPVWALYMDWKDAPMTEVQNVQTEVKRILERAPEVAAASLAGSMIPYGQSTSITGVSKGEADFYPHVWGADADFPAVMDIALLEGRWFDRRDAAAAHQPIVINKTLREQLFGDKNAVNELITHYDDKKLQIVGVVGNYKYEGEFSKLDPGYFFQIDTTRYPNVMVMKVRPSADAAFEAQLMRQLNQLAAGWSFELRYMKDMRRREHNQTLVPVLILLIISGFLIFNVALGLFGVLYYNINKRRQEVGVRRAMGANRGHISAQFIGEVLVIATFSLAPGLFFAIQFPLLQVFAVPGSVYFIAVILAILLIYTLVLLCSFYPGRQAAQLHPAVALHEE